jgi:archaellum component FlaC
VEVDYDQYQVKKEFQKLRDLYCRESKSNIVMKKNLEKLKARVDKVTRDIKIKEYLNLKDGDIARIIKPVQKPPQQPSQPSRHAG